MPSKRHASHENNTKEESKAKRAKTLANNIHEACLAGEIDRVKVLLKDGEMEAEVLDEIAKKGTLMTLCKNRKEALIKELLKNGVTPNCKNHEGQTPLHVACSQGYADIVRELLNHGANVDEMCNKKRTPLLSMNLWELSDEIAMTITKMLIDHGADINAQRGYAQGYRDRGQDHKTFLRLAVDKGNLPLVCELLKHGAEVNCRDYYSQITLHGAAEYDGVESEQMIRELMKYGADIDAEDDYSDTPLHIASRTGNVHVVRELMRHDPKLQIYNSAGQSATEISALKDNGTMIREFLKWGDKEIIFRQCHLNAATYYGNIEVVKALLDHGIEVNSNWEEEPYQTPLHNAALKGYLEIAHELLEHGADINAQDEDGKTPIHWLLEGDSTCKIHPELDDYPEEELLEVMELFLDEKYGIDLTITCFTEDDEKTPLQTAIKLGRLKMARRLSKFLCSEPKITDSIYPLKHLL